MNKEFQNNSLEVKFSMVTPKKQAKGVSIVQNLLKSCGNILGSISWAVYFVLNIRMICHQQRQQFQHEPEHT